MRPRGWYAVYTMGKVTHVVRGHQKARSVYKDRAYKRFTTKLAAEEWAAWWNYEHPRHVLGRALSRTKE